MSELPPPIGTMESKKRKAEEQLDPRNADEASQATDKPRLSPFKERRNAEVVKITVPPEDALNPDTNSAVCEDKAKTSAPIDASGGFLAYAKTNPFQTAMAANSSMKNPFATNAASLVSDEGGVTPSPVIIPDTKTNGNNPGSGSFSASAKGNRSAMPPPPLMVPSPRSPKANPFSSPSPRHNPFLSYVESNDDLWNAMARDNSNLTAEEAMQAKAKFFGSQAGGGSVSSSVSSSIGSSIGSSSHMRVPTAGRGGGGMGNGIGIGIGSGSVCGSSYGGNGSISSSSCGVDGKDGNIFRTKSAAGSTDTGRSSVIAGTTASSAIGVGQGVGVAGTALLAATASSTTTTTAAATTTTTTTTAAAVDVGGGVSVAQPAMAVLDGAGVGAAVAGVAGASVAGGLFGSQTTMTTNKPVLFGTGTTASGIFGAQATFRGIQNGSDETASTGIGKSIIECGNGSSSIYQTSMLFSTSSADTKDETAGVVAETDGGAEERDSNGDNDYEQQHEEENGSPGKSMKIISLPDNVKLVTGEEEEQCLLQFRAKLYRLSVCKPAVSLSSAPEFNSGSGSDGGAVGGSVLDSGAASHVENFLTSTTPTTTTAAPTAIKPPASAGIDINTAEWIEVGIGPLKLLENKGKGSGEPAEAEAEADGDEKGVNGASAAPSGRLVMRREERQGGVGTKLILNVRLNSLVSVAKQSEKTFRLMCVNFADSSGTTTTTTSTSSDSSSGSCSSRTAESLQGPSTGLTVAAGGTGGSSVVPVPIMGTYLIKTKLAQDCDDMCAMIQKFVMTREE